MQEAYYPGTEYITLVPQSLVPSPNQTNVPKHESTIHEKPQTREFGGIKVRKKGLVPSKDKIAVNAKSSPSNLGPSFSLAPQPQYSLQATKTSHKNAISKGRLHP